MALLVFSCAVGHDQRVVLPSPASILTQASPSPLGRVSLEVYRAAKTETARRAIGFRAIDEGIISRGGAIGSVDELFGSSFRQQLVNKSHETRRGVIHFLPEANSSGSENRAEARAFGGWHLVVDFDDRGKILKYYFTNLDKGMSSVVDTKESHTLADLKQRYHAATTALDRRSICLQAIDSSVIVTNSKIDVIDEIFSTTFSAHLPTTGENRRLVYVPFKSVEPPNAAETWFLAIEYDYNGDIQNYYLSNVK
jgi:hypothetical protein